MNEEATTILPGLAGKMVKYCPLLGPNWLQLGEFGPLASLERNDLVWIFFFCSSPSPPKSPSLNAQTMVLFSPFHQHFLIVRPLIYMAFYHPSTLPNGLSLNVQKAVFYPSLPICLSLSVKTHGVLPTLPSPPNCPSHNAQSIVCYLSYYVLSLSTSVSQALRRSRLDLAV